MNPQDPLAALHPLREPLPISWWPPAPGWWILAVLCLLSVFLLLWWLRKRHAENAYRRQAIAELNSLRSQYLADTDAQTYLASTNALLKSAALIAYPRREVAASSGAQWLTFLNTSAARENRFPDAFASSAYKQDIPEVDVELIHRAATHWVKTHKVAS